ncbi:MAG: DoxX family membrane protein [Bacteroidota bacterium]
MNAKKIVGIIARVLLGLMMTVFGLNKFFGFIPNFELQGPAKAFMELLFNHGMIKVVGGVEVLTGLLILTNRFLPLALILLGPIIVNILMFHIFLDPASAPAGVFAAVLWLVLAFMNKSRFECILKA